MTATVSAGIVVGVGDCRVAASGSLSLKTYALGSCVAVIVYDWRNRLGGLLHVMLPDSGIDRVRASVNPFVYVDTGVAELFRLFEQQGGSSRRLLCCVAGGASMMADSAHFEIGKRNYAAVRKALWRKGVFVDHEDVGGTESRSVCLDLSTGQIDLQKGSGRARILVPPGISLLTGSFK